MVWSQNAMESYFSMNASRTFLMDKARRCFSGDKAGTQQAKKTHGAAVTLFSKHFLTRYIISLSFFGKVYLI